MTEKYRPIHLIVQYYRAATPGRQAEIDTCLRENLLNPLIDAVHLLTEEEFDLSGFLNPEKVQQTVIGERLTYEKSFSYANGIDPNGGNIWILSNADIYFDESLRFLPAVDFSNQVFALTRHNVMPDGSIEFMPEDCRHGCQDAWIFTTPMRLEKMSTDFRLGIPSCDHRIAHEFVSAGYLVLNPSFKIIAIHLDHARNDNLVERVTGYIEVTNEEGYKTGKATPPPHQLYLYPTEMLEVTAYDLFIKNLEELKAADIKLNNLYNDLMNQLMQKDSQIFEKDRQLVERDAQIVEKDRQLVERDWHISERDRHIIEQDRQITSLLNSWSWKITKPLRRIITLLR